MGLKMWVQMACMTLGCLVGPCMLGIVIYNELMISDVKTLRN